MLETTIVTLEVLNVLIFLFILYLTSRESRILKSYSENIKNQFQLQNSRIQTIEESSSFYSARINKLENELLTRIQETRNEFNDSNFKNNERLELHFNEFNKHEAEVLNDLASLNSKNKELCGILDSTIKTSMRSFDELSTRINTEHTQLNCMQDQILELKQNQDELKRRQNVLKAKMIPYQLKVELINPQDLKKKNNNIKNLVKDLKTDIGI